MITFLCDKCGGKYSHEATALRCCNVGLNHNQKKANRIKTEKLIRRERYLLNRAAISISNKAKYLKSKLNKDKENE